MVIKEKKVDKMSVRRPTARTSSNYGYGKVGDRTITVSQTNVYDWGNRFSGNFSSFLSAKGRQFLNANPDFIVGGGFYLAIDFDFETEMFYGQINSEGKKHYLGRKAGVKY